MISEEWELARTERCEGCEFNGMVSPDGILPPSEGCFACSCPFATKRRMYKHYRKKGKEDEPLTPAELLTIKALKGVLPSMFEEVTTKCTHPDGNKWEDVDKLFSNQ